MLDMAEENKRPAAPEIAEVATTRDGRDITRGYIDQTHYLYPQDKVLRYRGANNYELYEDLLQDDRIYSALSQRRSAVTSRTVQVLPGGDRRADRKAAEALSETLKRIRWRSVCEKMLYGVYYGYSVAEILWIRRGSMIDIDAIKVRNRRRFVFDLDFRPRLLTHASPQGEELPDRKFWTFATGADHDDEPYGRGLAHWLYWLVWFKKHQARFWLTALEKFGSPTVVGKYNRAASPQERDTLLRAIEDVRIRTGIAMPDDMLIELLEATRSGAMDYAAFREAMDRAITMVILTQTMTSEDGSSLSQAQVHMDVREEVVEADANLISESFSRGPARWLTELNFPGAAIPRVEFVMPDDMRLAARSERDERISRMGHRLDPDYIEETYDVRLDAAAPPRPREGADMAEGDEGDALIAALDAIDAEEWEKLASPLIRPILDRAKSDPEELMSDIAGLYPELDADAVEAQLMRIIFVSDTWERLAAQRENA